MYNPLYELALKQLINLPSDIQIIVLHPNYNQQHLLLNHFLGQTSPVYVRFNGQDLTHSQLVEQFDNEILIQTGTTKLDNITHFILDECDRADSQALDSYLPDLVSRTTARIVIMSRKVPQCLLEDGKLRERTCFIPVEKYYMLLDYAQHNSDQVLLQIRALGAGQVMLDGRIVDNWDGLLPRSLFFYLVDRGMTTRSQIFETFWPNLSVREATNVFHVTKRKISEVLGVDLTVYWSGFYHISPKINLNYDVILFSEMVQNSAVALLDDAVDLLRQAVSFYRGDFLTSMDSDWVLKRRQELHQTYSEALIGLAKAIEKSGEPKQALGLYLQAANTNRQREDIARSIMTIYRDMGFYEDAISIYKRLEDELEHSLGVSPASQLQNLAQAIQQEIIQKV